jgi:hypothetical protein
MVLKASVALAVAVSVLAAFLFVRTSDEAFPVGTRSVLTVWDLGDDVGRHEAVATISAAADRHGIALFKDVLEVDGATTVRVLSQLGETEETAGSYPDFSRSTSTRRAAREAVSAAEVHGQYDSPATLHELDAVAAELRGLGMDVSTSEVSLMGKLLWAASEAPLLPSVLSVGIVIVIGALHWTETRRRRDAVLVCHGAGPTAPTRRNARRVFLYFVLATTVALAVSVPVLDSYNGLAQWPRFARAALAATSLAAASFVVVFVMAGLRAAAVGPQPGIDRRPPAARAVVVSTAAHSLCLLLTIGILGSGHQALDDLGAGRLEAARWGQAQEWSTVAFHSSAAEGDASVEAFAAIAREEQDRGQLLIVVHPVGPFEGNGPDHGNSLTVNPRFLHEEDVRDAHGRRIEASALDPGALTLLVPPAAAHDEAALIEDWASWAAWESSDEGKGREPAQAVKIDVVALEPGQSVFNFGTMPLDLRSSQTDPVVAVLPSARDVVSSNWLMSAMTSSGVLFSDRASVDRRLAGAGLTDQIGSIDRAADVAAVRTSLQERSLITVLAVALLTVLTAATSAIVLAGIVADRGRRRDVLRHVHGESALVSTLRSAGALTACGVAVLLSSRVLGLCGGPGVTVLGAAAVVVDLVLVSVLIASARTRSRRDALSRP